MFLKAKDIVTFASKKHHSDRRSRVFESAGCNTRSAKSHVYVNRKKKLSKK